MKRQRYDIFISYRRKGGDVTARSIYDRLTMMGYRVSYDIETLRVNLEDMTVRSSTR